MTIDIILALIIGVVTAGVIIILRELKGSRGEKGNERIIVRGGVDVDTQRLGGEKGDFFEPLKFNTTIRVDGTEQQAWGITFTEETTGRQMRFSFHRRLIIGRRPAPEAGDTCFVLPEDTMVSRNHCEIFARGAGLVIRDLGAKNPAVINGRRLQGEQFLAEGDRVSIGKTAYRVTFTHG